MWFNTIDNYEMDDEDIRSLLEDIAYDNKEYFCPDEMIDECYTPAVYCDISFSPSEIIKKLDPTLYQTIQDEEIDYWIGEAISDVNRYSPEEGDTLNSCIYAPFSVAEKKLDEIVWREH